jgi:hypothetical protein
VREARGKETKKGEVMMTLFTDTERLVSYLQDNGVRIIRHTADCRRFRPQTGMDGETVDILTCQFPSDSDIHHISEDPTEPAGDVVDLQRRLDKAEAHSKELENMLTARVTPAELRKVSGEWGQDKEDPKGE